MSRLNSLYTDQFESLNMRAKQLVSDATRIFFDPDIPIDLALRARTEQTEFYNTLMEIVSRIQLQDVDGTAASKIARPFGANQQFTVFGSLPQSETLAFEIFFDKTKHPNNSPDSPIIFTKDKYSN